MPLLSQSEITVRELSAKSNDQTLPRVPGFEDLPALEARVQQAQVELEERRQDIAQRQRSLEGKLEDLNRARKTLSYGDQFCGDLKSTVTGLEDLICSTLSEGDYGKTRRVEALHLLVLNERFAKLWAKGRKQAVEDIQRIEDEISTLMSKGSE